MTSTATRVESDGEYHLGGPMGVVDTPDVDAALREVRAAARGVRDRTSPSFGRQLLHAYCEDVAAGGHLDVAQYLDLVEAERIVVTAVRLQRREMHYPNGRAVSELVAWVSDTVRWVFDGVPPAGLHLLEPITHYAGGRPLLQGVVVDPAAVDAPADVYPQD